MNLNAARQLKTQHDKLPANGNNKAVASHTSCITLHSKNTSVNVKTTIKNFVQFFLVKQWLPISKTRYQIKHVTKIQIQLDICLIPKPDINKA